MLLFLQAYADFVISVMGKICAPVRDDQIKKLAEMTDAVSVFRGIMEVRPKNSSSLLI